jgi:hypothetical protein
MKPEPRPNEVLMMGQREYWRYEYAGRAMQMLIPDENYSDPRLLANAAVKYADALLKEMDRTQGKQL